MTANSWFAVDKEGLAKLLERRGKSFAVLELLQNAWDEDGVTEVRVGLNPIPERPLVALTVTDDAPDGFKDLKHAYTLFAESAKKTDPAKRGRFNLGEKLVLAICEEAKVFSTRGVIVFRRDGERHDLTGRTTQKLAKGTKFEATVRMTRSEFEEAARVINSVIVPANIETYLNDERIWHREPLKCWAETLETEIAGEDGQLRRTRRQTTVEVYEVDRIAGEVPTIYEMGIPVVEHDGRWHVNLLQKVPLNMDRDNVTPAYLRALRSTVLNHTFELIDRDDANSAWVKDALPQATEDAVRSVVEERFGRKVVVFDPSDPEANKRALDSGYVVVHGRSLSKEEWGAVRRADALKPAGQVMPSGVQFSPDGIPPIDPDEWQPGMRRVAAYTSSLCKHLLGTTCTVKYYRLPRSGKHWQAAWKGISAVKPWHELDLNLTWIDGDWFDRPRSHQKEWDALLLHEFAHNICGDHFRDEYIEALANLGASLRDYQGTL